jgi:hypothetical protein
MTIVITKVGRVREWWEAVRALRALEAVLCVLGDEDIIVAKYGEIPHDGNKIDLIVQYKGYRVGAEIVPDIRRIESVKGKLQSLLNQGYIDKALVIIEPPNSTLNRCASLNVGGDDNVLIVG